MAPRANENEQAGEDGGREGVGGVDEQPFGLILACSARSRRA